MARLKSEKGSALLLVLGVVAFLSLGFYFMSDYILRQRSVVLKNNSLLHLRMALHSAVDYTVYGIRQRWCFHESFQQDPDCTLNHPASVERITMSRDQERFILDMVEDGTYTGGIPNGGFPLESFSRTVNLKTLSRAHPLSMVGAHLKLQGIGGIKISVVRDQSAQLPRAGREVFLRVHAVFLDEKNNPLLADGRELSVSSYLSVHPREVGTFALVMARDLRLDVSFDSSTGRGDGSLHHFGGGAEGMPGLRFLSPVFVNRDLHLPESGSEDGSRSSGYTPVTFGERVILGAGKVYSKGQPYKPASAGGLNERLWASNASFGGFQKGIESDGLGDRGLDYMSGNEEGSPVDGSLMRQCIQRNLARTTYEAIENSRLYGVLRDRQYRLWLTDGNGFMAQESETRDFTVNGWDSSRKKDPVTRFGGNRLAVAETTLQAGSNFLKGAVPMNGGFKVTGPAPSQELEKEAQGRLADSKSRKEKAEKSLADLRNEKSDMEREKRQAEDRLSGERAKPSGSQDSGLISRLEREISDLKSKIDQLTKVRIPEAESRIESAEKDIREAQLFIDEIRDWKEKPAFITMTVLPVRQENYVQPHKADLKIEIENPQNLREPWGARIDQILAGVTAYDPAFFEGTLIVSDLLHRDRVTGYAKMRYDTASKTYLLPPGLSVSASSGPVTDQPEDNTNYGKIDKQCEEAGSTAGGSSFGKASWDYSFAANTRHSWNFAGASGSTDETDPLLSELVFDRLNSSIAMGTATFQVRSIVGKCIVKATAEFVTGFLTCDDFIVEPRTMPLRIIGTIVASKLSIDPSAYQAGLVWSSIYHPQAALELRAAGILKSQSGAVCGDGGSPVWHPIPSLVEVSDRMACNPISLRAKADPFQWTTVDPDCGLLPGRAATSCKKRITRFLVVEHSREMSL